MRALTILYLLTWMACVTDTDTNIEEATDSASLSSSSTDAEIMEHLYQAEVEQKATDALTTHFPAMPRERAYAIQKLRLVRFGR